MSHNNAYFVCGEHGSIYVLPEVNVFSRMDFEKLEVLVQGIDLPDGNDRVACPLCGNNFRIFFGN